MFVTAACDDECTGVLLDDLEKIHNHFLSVNLSSVAMAPYRQLVLLENRTKDVQVNTHTHTTWGRPLLVWNSMFRCSTRYDDVHLGSV